MPQIIRWTLNVEVIGGPRLSLSSEPDLPLIVDAYDKLLVNIEDMQADKEVQVQPGDSGQVQFLVISSDKYDPKQEDAKLTYKVNEASTDFIRLDAPHPLIGEGAVGLLNPAPKTLLFSNQLGSDVAIQILVGRKAMP